MRRFSITITALALAVSSCGTRSVQTGTLSIGLMPAVDIAPVLVAADKGYFADEGLELSYQVFTSAQDRQSALQVGAIDGALTDLVALSVNAASGFGLKATMMTDGMFAVMARANAPESGRASIGLMEVSVTNYLAERWLASGLDLDKVYINDIGARLEALASGQLDLAVLPEPLASVARARGLMARASSRSVDDSPQVMAFTEAALRDKTDAIRAFHTAYARAVRDIAANPDLARDALASAIPNVTPELAAAMGLPEYREPALPSDAFLADILDWTESVVGKLLDLEPADLVDGRFVR